MEIEAIDDRPSNPQGASRENGEALSAAIPATTERLAPIEVSTLTERIESLERQHSQLRRDALMIAGLTTIAAALAIATMFEKRMEPQAYMQPVLQPRAISAQAFLLTDAQGHPRSKLTFE